MYLGIPFLALSQWISANRQVEIAEHSIGLAVAFENDNGQLRPRRLEMLRNLR